MKKSLLLFLPLLACMSKSFGQTPYNTKDYVNINNIKASVLVHGDMWWDPLTQTSNCFYPATSTKTISFNAALWMSGYDASSQLHVASQMYRQNGNDYWPGPIDSATGVLDSATSLLWNKIWKVNRTTIDSFRVDTNAHTTTNTPSAILRWPGKGNTYAQGYAGMPLTITRDMAPFVDRNGNGVYEPLLGEYPAIKGDQTLWWIVSDKGPSHNESNGMPLGVEIHNTAYGYKRGTLIDNVIYYDYKIVNRSSNNYTNFRIGQFSDMDMGAPYDDYVGFDSAHRMGIIYNGGPFDTVYNTSIPMAGITMIILPGDAGTSYVPAGSFIYFNNDATMTGNPTFDYEYNAYLRSMNKAGVHITNDYTTPGIPTTGFGTGTATNYVFPGDPSDSTKWSECSSGNTPGDRRFVITSNDFNLNAGASQRVVMALVTTTQGPNRACGTTGLNFNDLKTVADTAWGIFFNPPPDTLVTGISTNPIANNVRMYPNPAHDRLFIETVGLPGSQESVQVYNAVGQLITLPVVKTPGKLELNISNLPNGMYNVLYRNGADYKPVVFVKE